MLFSLYSHMKNKGYIMNLNETIYNKNHIMGVEELSANTREIPFNQLMREFCDDYWDNDNCENFAVVWKEYHGEKQIEQIYNHDTGEIYWEDNFDEVDTPSGRDWNPNDEILYCSILMWGELEQTIG